MNSPRLTDRLPALLGDAYLSHSSALGEITCEVAADNIKSACKKLRDDRSARFETLGDLCGVDYARWGRGDDVAGSDGDSYSNSDNDNIGDGDNHARFAVVYHLRSLKHNRRLRLRARVADAEAGIDSVAEVWPGANWYEREAFDLFGIVFRGHPDLRRLLTDYGFIGHPFRKDFPLSGEVEMHYDEKHGRVVYRPVTIEPRTLVPRTIGANVVGDNDNESKNTGEN